VTIIVGQGEVSKTFSVYEDLLTAYSAFFRFCLGSGFKEAGTKRVELPDDKAEDFAAVVNWLYRESKVVKYDASRTATDRITSAYKLADKLIMPQLKNHLMDLLRELWKEQNLYHALESIEKLSLFNVAGDKLYDFTLKMYVWILSTQPRTIAQKATAEAGTFANAALMQDLFTMVREYNSQKWDDPRFVVGCHWHDHSDGSKCEAVVAPGKARVGRKV